jgi:hypothetical protein
MSFRMSCALVRAASLTIRGSRKPRGLPRPMDHASFLIDRVGITGDIDMAAAITQGPFNM